MVLGEREGKWLCGAVQGVGVNPAVSMAPGAWGRKTPRKLWRNNWAAGLPGWRRRGGGGVEGGGQPGGTGAGQSRAPEGRGPSGPGANGVRELAAPGAQSLLDRGAGRGQNALGGLLAPAWGTAVRTAPPSPPEKWGQKFGGERWQPRSRLLRRTGPPFLLGRTRATASPAEATAP